jgi:hypothetical protein
MKFFVLLVALAAADHAVHEPTPPTAATVRFVPPLEGAAGRQLDSLGDGRLAIALTPAVVRTATLSWGDEALWHHTAHRAMSGEPLRVWVLGASPSCGHHDPLNPAGGPAEEVPRGLNHTFAGVLLAGLTKLYPTTNSHTVVTECHGGASSDRWTQEVARWRTSKEGPFRDGADIVVLEAGLTDGGAPALVLRTVEILLRQWFAAVPRPAVILLSTAGSRGKWNAERLGDAALVHQQVALHYGVHQVSVADAFLPSISEERAQWFRSRVRSDTRGHPSLLGHDLIGSLLLQAVSSLVASASFRFLPAEPPRAFPLREQRYSSPSEAAAFVRGHPKVLRLDDADNEQRGAQYWKPLVSNWTLYSDGRDAGLIADQVGSTIAFSFPPAVVLANFVYGVVIVSYLKTYEGVGSLRVRVIAGAWVEGQCQTSKTVAALTVDALWNNTYSESYGEEIHAKHEPRADVCIEVEITCVESNPARLRNKVKLYSVVLL